MARFAHLATALLSGLALSTMAAPGRANLAASDSRGAPAPPTCQASLAGVDFSVPANTPALILGGQADSSLTETVTAELVSADGVRSPLGAPTRDPRGTTTMKLPSVPVGTYTLTTKVTCSNGAPDQSHSVSLTLTPPGKFPTTVGTLRVRPNLDPRGTETILVEPSAELRAFRFIAMTELTLNGEKAPVPAGASFELIAHTGSVCVENGALIRDKRTIKAVVSAYLAGVAEVPAPATLDVVVDCGAIKWTSESDFRQPSETGPGASPTEPNSPAGGNSSAGGCAAAKTSALSGSTTAFTLGTLALLAWRRRRQQSQRG